MAFWILMTLIFLSVMIGIWIHPAVVIALVGLSLALTSIRVYMVSRWGGCR